MMDSFAPKDNHLDDNDYHKSVRCLVGQPADTEDDREFTKDEVANTIATMNNNKAPGTNGISGNIYKQVFNTVPNFVTALYNGCLNRTSSQLIGRRQGLSPVLNQGEKRVTK
jgi:hypothetical protein